MIFPQYKNRSASFLDEDMNFFSNKNGSASHKDADLNFSQLKTDLYLWGANDLWARPIYPGRVQRPKPRRIMAQVQQNSLWVPPRVIQSSTDPQYPQREG